MKMTLMPQNYFKDYKKKIYFKKLNYKKKIKNTKNI